MAVIHCQYLKRRNKMKLTPPKNVTFWLAIFLGVFGVLATYFIQPISGYGIWFITVGFVVLALGNLLKGL
jgi:fatty acid desaturase